MRLGGAVSGPARTLIWGRVSVDAAVASAASRRRGFAVGGPGAAAGAAFFYQSKQSYSAI